MVDWKISIKKGIYVFLMGGVTALIDFLSGYTGSPELILYTGAAIAFLRIIQDAIKHWND